MRENRFKQEGPKKYTTLKIILVALVLMGLALWVFKGSAVKEVCWDQKIQYYGLTEEIIKCTWTEGDRTGKCVDKDGHTVRLYLTPAKLEWLRNELLKANR